MQRLSEPKVFSFPKWDMNKERVNFIKDLPYLLKNYSISFLPTPVSKTLIRVRGMSAELMKTSQNTGSLTIQVMELDLIKKIPIENAQRVSHYFDLNVEPTAYRIEQEKDFFINIEEGFSG